MFKKTSVPLLIILVACVSCVPYNNYVFESFWLGTICTFQPCLSNQTSNISSTWWNIHGLWPGYQVGWPQYCNNNSQYDPTVIQPALYQQMSTLWIGMNESNDMFHEHEWTKHGTCWNDQINFVNQSQKMNDFFTKVISIAQEFDFYQTLALYNITPSETPYTLSDINAALTEEWGSDTFTFDCLEDTDGNQYLLDLNICLDLNYNKAPCPVGDATTCTDSDIYYLPISF